MPIETPLVLVTIGDAAVPGAVSLHVESLGYFCADRFRVELAIGAAAFATADYFVGLGPATISIAVDTGSGFTQLIVGQVDHIHIDLLRNMAVLSGRDFSGRLIDAQIAETFNNQTSSQIATTIAARFGLAANVTATSTPVGQYYELDHAHTALGLNSRITTAWNLLSQLALTEGFVLAVTGNNLLFGPASITTPVVLAPRNLMELQISLATNLPLAATVRSWNSRNKMAVTQTEGAAGGTVLIRPNLTAVQASAAAAAHVTALGRHQTVLSATMPGDVSLLPEMQILLGETNSSLDQAYTISAVTRRIDGRRGFTQTIEAYAA